MVDGSDADEKTKAFIVKGRALVFSSPITAAAKKAKEQGDKSNSCRRRFRFSAPPTYGGERGKEKKER